MKDRLRCHWCAKFLSEETKTATVKDPNIFYCEKCWMKGVEIEREAMGYYDSNP